MNGTTRRNLIRVGGQVIGLALLVLAMVYAIQGVQWSVFREADLLYLVLLALAVLGNLAITSLLFWQITLSFDARPTVPLWTMTKLIAASGLLNYVPVVRPGLWARAAYLKARHGLPLRQSIMILVVTLVLAAVLLGTATAVLLLFRPLAQGIIAAVGIVALSVVTGPIARRALGREVRVAWAWLPLRVVDWAVTAARLWLAFTIIGESVGYREALLASAASMVVRLVGLTPNGMGLSEWAVAAVTAAASPVSAAAGAAAALVDRAVEVAVAIATGALAAWGLRGVGLRDQNDAAESPHQ